MDLLHQLKDIKPSVTITDYTIYIAILILLLLIALIVYIVKNITKTQSDQYLEALKHLDYANPKKSAYQFTKYARLFINDENKQQYEAIVAKLEKYKYKPKVDPLNREIIEEMKKFIEDIK